MAKTDVQFLEDRISMTGTDGWLDLLEDIKNLQDSIANVENIHSEKDLWEIKGQLRVINFILSLENATNLALEELQDGNST
jgi:hypothetical protein